MKKRMAVILVSMILLIAFYGLSIAEYVTETIDDNGTWTDTILCPKGGQINVSIDPNGIMTLTLQRWLPGDTKSGETLTFDRNVETWTITASDDDLEYITAYPEPEYCYYRLGCNATAEHSSGDAAVRLGIDSY